MILRFDASYISEDYKRKKMREEKQRSDHVLARFFNCEETKRQHKRGDDTNPRHIHFLKDDRQSEQVKEQQLTDLCDKRKDERLVDI